MRRTFVALIAFLLSVFASFAQLTIDGKRLAYDRLTHSYLLSVPLSEFGKQFEKPIVIDDTVSWVLINGRQVRTSVNLPTRLR